MFCYLKLHTTSSSPLLAPSPPSAQQQHIQPGCPLPLLPGGAVTKNPPASVGGASSIPGSRISPGEGNGYPLQYSCLENSRDRRGWRATVQGVTELDMTEANERLPPPQTDAESPMWGMPSRRNRSSDCQPQPGEKPGTGKPQSRGSRWGELCSPRGSRTPDTREDQHLRTPYKGSSVFSYSRSYPRNLGSEYVSVK